MLWKVQTSKGDELPLQTDCLIGGTWTGNDTRIAVLDNYTGATVAEVAQVSALNAVARPVPNVTERAAILLWTGELLSWDCELFQRAMIGEAGLACADADNEIDRAPVTIVLSAEASSARADVMPFDGVKDSGFGHEGPDHAIREMSDERLIAINEQAG